MSPKHILTQTPVHGIVSGTSDDAVLVSVPPDELAQFLELIKHDASPDVVLRYVSKIGDPDQPPTQVYDEAGRLLGFVEEIHMERIGPNYYDSPFGTRTHRMGGGRTYLTLKILSQGSL